MNKSEFDNNIRQQCLCLEEIVQIQVDNSLLGIKSILNINEWQKIRKIIFTGCGDSFMAANIALSSFNFFGKKFGHDFEAVPCIDFSKSYNINKRDAEASLLIVVSVSGNASRIKESLLRARKLGVKSILITDNPDSESASMADHVLNVNTPKLCEPNLGLYSYFASLVTLFLLGAHFAEVKSCVEGGTLQNLAQQIVIYTKSFFNSFEDIDNKAFNLALLWKDYKSFDLVGDDKYFYSANFIRAKFVESSGVMCSLNNSEDWCHVQYFEGLPQSRPVLVICSANDNNDSRIRETLRQADNIKRPIMLTSTEANYNVPKEFLFEIPKANYDLSFLECLVNYIPGSLIAGYYAALNNAVYFRGGDAWLEGNTIKSSKIEV